MNTRRIYIREYRNLKDIELEPCDSINVFFGDNAQGKTNILECIWSYTGLKSFSGFTEAESIPKDSDGYYSEMEFEDEGEINRAALSSYRGEKKCVLNGTSKKTSSHLYGKFLCSVFSPAHMALVKEGPKLRRNYLDCGISQLKRGYSDYLKKYSGMIAQRNALLKDLDRHSELLETLELWDEMIADTGAYIIKTRQAYFEQLTPHILKVYDGICEGREPLRLKLRQTVETEQESSQEKIKEAFIRKLSSERVGDIAAKMTRFGPHRDDIEIMLCDTPARSFASQGQQRSIALSMKLGEADFLKGYTKKVPVILLDDVLSELDHARQNYVLNHITGFQVFITCCYAEVFSKSDMIRVYNVSNGRILQ